MAHNIMNTPDYVRKQIDEIFSSEEIQKIIKDTSIQKNVDAITRKNPNLHNLLQLPAWIEIQYKRYDKVFVSIESSFKKMGKILPPEPGDFMDWFYNKYALRGDLNKLKIEDVHFEEYHKARLRKIEPPTQWDGLFEELKAYGYIFTTKSIFYDAMEYKSLQANSDKILWLKSKADAIAFQEDADFTMKQFNRCFKTRDGKPFALNQKTGIVRKEPLNTILRRYFPDKHSKK